MTHTITEQPEALQVAEWLRKSNDEAMAWREDGADAIERLYSRVQQLEDENARLIETYVPKPAPTETYENAIHAQRAPLSDEDVYDITRGDGPELLRLAQKWMDNELHVYQYSSQAEAIVIRAVRATEAAHGITQQKQG